MSRNRDKKKQVSTKGPEPANASKAVRQEKFPERYSAMNLSWRMSAVDLNGDWGWERITHRELAVITRRLKDFEVMTLADLERTGSHQVEKNGICREAQRRLSDIELDDIDHLFSFRIMKKKRVWGILEGSIIKIIWWDPHHTVWPMNIADN